MDSHIYARQELIHTTQVYSYDEYHHEDSDDVFYDELRKQVLELTAEEDEDESGNKITNTIQGQKQGLYNGPRPIFYYDWPGNKEDCASAPAWMLNAWRSGNGTGVFIPQTVQSRRRNRSRRNKNERGRTYKRVEKMN